MYRNSTFLGTRLGFGRVNHDGLARDIVQELNRVGSLCNLLADPFSRDTAGGQLTDRVCRACKGKLNSELYSFLHKLIEKAAAEGKSQDIVKGPKYPSTGLAACLQDKQLDLAPRSAQNPIAPSLAD